jgi:diguanylate cyclase (GGDEF)-like protein
MGSKMIALNLSRDIKKMVGVNAFLLIFFIPALLFYVKGIEDISVVSLIACWGLIMSLGNFLFIHHYVTEKTELELKRSLDRMQQQLSFDELTGVYNRRGGMSRLKEEFARARRHGRTIAIAMADIDKFKNINDTYGHLAGDKVIQSVAESLKSQLRECDLVIRFGGEEFLVVMPDTTEQQAIQPLDRVRQILAYRPIRFENQTIRCSISIGVASIAPEETDIIDALSRADQALYCAKQFGRNRVVHRDLMSHLQPVLQAHAHA